MELSFSAIKNEFDKKYNNKTEIEILVPEHLTTSKIKKIRKEDGSVDEEYYKWQFIYSIINSGLVPLDYVGTEVHLPKGNKSSAQLKIDGAIFDDSNWFDFYKRYHEDNDNSALDWLRNHLIAVIEFKKEDNKDIEVVWNKQLKAYLKESEREFCLGILYDTEKLYLFKSYEGKYLRYSDEFNLLGEKSQTKDLALHIPDSYSNLPSLNKLIDWNNHQIVDISKRIIEDLDIISGIQSIQINNAMSSILRVMDKKGMVNQKGYDILIQVLALKIFDEKRNEKNNKRFLDFYITNEERNYKSLADESLQVFIGRIKKLREDASEIYYRILKENPLNFKNKNHIDVLIEVVMQFQDYSFVKSHKTDLYQLVFYRFATPFSKDQNAQFITPLPLIDFLVKIINPRSGETIIDPTVGIADFLSVAYVNSQSKLDDNNIYGLDIDEDMVKLATLNMLLNGDGNAKIKAQPGYGSLLTKFAKNGELIDLIPSMNKDGKWDNRADETEIKKFDVVLTNPPFGDDRAFEPKDTKDKEVIECYELWNRYNSKKIDLGVIFLENAYRILKTNGRMGIVLSNSIASIDAHKEARKWLMEKMRIVSIFDLPDNIFAETGVNTTIIVAYKPEEEELKKLKEKNYQVFCKDIKKVGYEVKTKKRVKYFEKIFKMDEDTLELMIDNNGNVIIDEEFTETVGEFKKWCLGQEEILQELFTKEK